MKVEIKEIDGVPVTGSPGRSRTGYIVMCHRPRGSTTLAAAVDMWRPKWSSPHTKFSWDSHTATDSLEQIDR